MSIPENELQYWYITASSGENSSVLLGLEHVSKMDWSQPSFVCATIEEILQQIKPRTT
jgi:hypothetical protein